MTPGQWSRIEQLYHAALERTESERPAFLDEACAGDRRVRREVESLLAHHHGAEDFLEVPALEDADWLPGGAASPPHERDVDLAKANALTTSYSPGQLEHSRERWLSPGERFGPYRIERLLGTGGMGEVYEAEELESGRRVAIKVLLRSLNRTADRARFLREGRLAASISDPHTVYVYGTDEIEGVPVIAMELAPAGTLKDRVSAMGPLQPSAAVDAIEQVIAGLEVAAAAGILHRDIKPSNCFVDSSGHVKVGDFGLSISTRARLDSHITMTGTVRATPAFASPEQLCGEELDVRSDIYSVGATLYYLLTGHAPFEDDNAIKLVSMVMQGAPRSPRELQQRIPHGLAQVVLRCLAKKSTDRFSSYAALTEALRPFDSTAPTPASLGLRFGAGVIDHVLLTALMLPIVFVGRWEVRWEVMWRHPEDLSAQFVTFLPAYLMQGLYYAVLEGYWGASIGKAVCGLRVIARNGERLGFAKALLRWLVFTVVFLMPGIALRLAAGPQLFRSLVWTPNVAGLVATAMFFTEIALVFSTARRKNGFAALHDLASQTRVTLHRIGDAPPVVHPSHHVVRAPASAPRFGPYHGVTASIPDHRDEVVMGYDDRLNRNIWLHVLPPGSPAVSAARRDMSRPARLRWLAGRRTAEESWDAYEAVEGQPLVDVLDKPHSWRVVRHWLQELAEEAAASMQDRTLPDIGLDRVWITEEGHAKLLDWPAPGTVGKVGKGTATTPSGLDGVQQFLHDVAVAGLNGRSFARVEGGTSVAAVPLPLRATAFVKKLDEHAFQDPVLIVSALDSLIRQTAVVSRRKRLAHLALCGVIPGFMFAATASGAALFHRWQTQDPARWDFFWCLIELNGLERNSAVLDAARYLVPQDKRIRARTNLLRERQALEIYIGSLFHDNGFDESIWLRPPMIFSPWLRMLGERALAAHPHPSREDLDNAARMVAPRLARLRRAHIPPLLLGSAVGAANFLLVAAIGLLSGVLFRGGLLFRAFGIAAVTTAGVEVSRARAVARAGIAWLPLVIGVIALFPGTKGFTSSAGRLLPWLLISALAFGVFLIGAVWAALHPACGLQDRLTGTSLVPK